MREPDTLDWVEELLPQDYFRKKMFGGFAYYHNEKLLLLIFESEGHTEYRGTHYDFEIWNGCMFPVEKEHQHSVLKQFSFLIQHPILPKWLYIPQNTEDFEFHVQSIMKELRKENPLFGTFPKTKGSKSKSKASSKKISEKFVPRPPQMFRNEAHEKTALKAKKISDMKNLGHTMEKVFLKAGIKNPQQMVKLGWKKVMEQLCKHNPKNNHSILAYAVIGALQDKIWNLISEEDKIEARLFMKSLRHQRASKKRR